METANTSKNGASSEAIRYRFDEFEVDPVNRVCTRGGETLPVSGKVYDILLEFLDNPGRLLTKDELLERVWPKEFVEEGNLARNVSTLRKLLGDNGKGHKFIVTVPGHGYRFAADVSVIKPGAALRPAPESPLPEINDVRPDEADRPQLRSRKLFWAGATFVLLFTAAWFGKDRFLTTSPTVRTIAVLPLKGIDPNDNYLGFGIADAVIRRLSSSGQVTVRPASAVLHYLNQETDTLSAARELNTDAILEGNVQRSGDRLRVNVNLLKTADGSSIWNDSFNMQSADLFRVEDEVAQQVADRLKIGLGNANRAGTSRYPSDPAAYESYIKGRFSFDQRGFTEHAAPQMMETIGYFKRSVEIDPNYAEAHAQLAVCYAWMGLFIKTNEPQWAGLARDEIAHAEQLDSNIAESHLARALLFWSFWGGYQMESAINELRTLKRLNPNFASPDLAALYGHIGLEDQANRELDRARNIDPTSQSLKGLVGILPYLRADPDAWKEVLDDPPEYREKGAWYYLRKGQLDQAQKVIDDRLQHSPDDYHPIMEKAMLQALRGQFAQAESEVPGVLASVPHNDESYHHQTYYAACIYALDGKSDQAVKWLRETANTGFPNYPLFARDPFLDRIRQSPEFIQFLSEQKSQWEHFEQEFAVE